MIEEALTRFPGVYRRSDSNIFQFGLRVPKDLAGLYRGAWAVRCSLKTADLREANSKARQLQKQWDEKFEQQRVGTALQARPVVQAPPDLTRLRTELLRRLESILDGMDARIASYPPEERRERAGELRWARDDTQQGLECGYVPDWQVEWLDGISASLGVTRSPVVDSELLKHFVAVQDIQIEALTDFTGTYPVRVSLLDAKRRLLRGAAPPVPNASDQDASGANARRKMEDALALWKAAASRPAKTIEAFTRHARMFAELTGDPAVGEWTKATARHFRDALTAWAEREGRTAATADNVMLSVRAIASVAAAEDWIQINPFAGITVKKGGKASEKREPWKLEELAVLFDDPIWKQRQLPVEAKAGGAAAYWMPLIACYSGARLSEIAQLWTDDLDTEAGAECFEFRASEDRGQQLKNEGSWRSVPMHGELVRLGLPEYVKSLPLGPLFPELRRGGKNGPGGVFGGWFGTFKAGKGFNTPAKAFHSFRHLVSTELQLQGVHGALRNPILGHTGDGMGERVYGATIRRNAQRLRPHINLLDFKLHHLPVFRWDEGAVPVLQPLGRATAA